MPVDDRPLVFSTPSTIPTTATKEPQSWIQLCRTGKFHSNRYGEFQISKNDLLQMYRNFLEVTPLAPTELPIDFDHLSNDPKRPGDGIAAGWLKHLQLRQRGEELWGLVAWTPDASAKIAQQEYRFVSPSFVKDHTHKDGRKIGTTLLGAAITNHPFLEGMSALTLYDHRLSDYALVQEPAQGASMQLSAVGARVTFVANSELTEELTEAERSATYEIVAMRGVGEDAFVKLKTADGTIYGWFPASALAPAPAPTKDTVPPEAMKPQAPETPEELVSMAPVGVKRGPKSPIPHGYPIKASAITMTAQEADRELLSLSWQKAHEDKISLGEATKRVSKTRLDLVALRDGDALPEVLSGGRTSAAPVVNLSAQAPDFDSLCYTTARDRGISLAEAISVVARQHPDLAAAR